MSDFPRTHRVTIADVAREAGVSRTTVSHALSGQGKVNAATRDKVKEVAERLNYRPSVRAQSLRSGRSQTLALLSSMPAAVSAGPSQLGFFTELAMGCARTALLEGYVFVLAPPNEETNPVDLLDIDGAILLEPTLDDPLAEALRERGIPYVTIDGPGSGDAEQRARGAEQRARAAEQQVRDTEQRVGGASRGGAAGSKWSIDLHHQVTAQLLLDHLVDQGARQPALLVSRSRRGAQTAAREVYAATAEARGFAPLIAEADETSGEDGAYAATQELLAAHPDIDALLAPIDTFATGAVRAAEEAGRTIGDDLLIATRYDGLRARTSSPPLTAVDLGLEAISKAAVEMLVAVLDGHSTANDEMTDSVPTASAGAPGPRLVARESTTGPSS
ncbi:MULTISPECIES: LacI family DNA-binding transcriptional regulator [unclassified Brevibacterium]|uniref:LacI family DNA-binding transcriptional regulator n=1 Tax=unclassified Brevibacterium TaxID=2614124 RepID=UPI0010817967|nr:LacI family DNA-binding transcriptional regulator [Brevibacterium sp. S111]TGD10399.1 LacI family DNA-binding transcriptional regulator [Brevibacterium sp. S111]